MNIIGVEFGLCPARFIVYYKDDNGEDKYAYAFGFGTCYTCADYTLKRFAMGKRNTQWKDREAVIQNDKTEAIEELKLLRESAVPWQVPHLLEAIDVAIEALSERAVTCKDCKWYENPKAKIFKNCCRNDRLIPMEPNDYCSRGERKEK